MMDHLRTHSGNKPFACDICGKAFKQRAQLYKHVTIHDSNLHLNCSQERYDDLNFEVNIFFFI